MNSSYTQPNTSLSGNRYNRSTVEHAFLITWSGSSLLLSLAGNILILAAVYYRAFRIDKLSLLVIKHLAVSDIYFNAIWVLPTLVTLVAGNTWVLGTRLCEITTYLQYPPAIATILFITVLSANKYMRCKFPLQTLDLTTKAAYRITVGVWGFSLVHPALYFFSNLLKRQDKRAMELDQYKGSCDYHHGEDLSLYWNLLDMMCGLVYCMLPSVVLLASNAAILLIVKQKGRGNMKMSNLILIISITYLFFISYTPYTIKYMIPMLQLDKDIMPDCFKTVTYFLLYVNSWANAFIYYFTNTAFRNFVSSVIGLRGHWSARPSTCSAREPIRPARFREAHALQEVRRQQGAVTGLVRNRRVSAVVETLSAAPMTVQQSSCVIARPVVQHFIVQTGQAEPLIEQRLAPQSEPSSGQMLVVVKE